MRMRISEFRVETLGGDDRNKHDLGGWQVVVAAQRHSQRTGLEGELRTETTRSDLDP